jgi:hypothetical protein
VQAAVQVGALTPEAVASYLGAGIIPTLGGSEASSAVIAYNTFTSIMRTAASMIAEGISHFATVNAQAAFLISQEMMMTVPEWFIPEIAEIVFAGAFLAL